MYELIQLEGDTVQVHGKASRVSELVDFYYKHRRQYGYMEIIDTTNNNRVLATLNSK